MKKEKLRASFSISLLEIFPLHHIALLQPGQYHKQKKKRKGRRKKLQCRGWDQWGKEKWFTKFSCQSLPDTERVFMSGSICVKGRGKNSCTWPRSHPSPGPPDVHDRHYEPNLPVLCSVPVRFPSRSFYVPRVRPVNRSLNRLFAFRTGFLVLFSYVYSTGFLNRPAVSSTRPLRVLYWFTSVSSTHPLRVLYRFSVPASRFFYQEHKMNYQ